MSKSKKICFMYTDTNGLHELNEDVSKKVNINPNFFLLNRNHLFSHWKSQFQEATFKEGVLGNYEIKRKPKSGPGEGGSPVFTTESERQTGQAGLNRYGFNLPASEKISFDRSIKDTRQKEYYTIFYC